ncbi:High affinity cationic amino acid transporter 1 [Holothuria leucospilota]|uniref:High affinity cationic amino acid transporter 1 n=1 Tax=Holothuria leucospilota TaxID=206669 RepID=A0A9Q0YKG8_HOLLE|nr:High affinity cationic amino acid transporter 1 [Holothuria leucospilota]
MASPLWKRLERKKRTVDKDASGEDLKKYLELKDLTALGIGSTLGVGLYVLAGDVARSTAGPAIVISFLLAAVVSLLTGFCYAEFGARVHVTGSAYSFAYVAIGEFVAFAIGWSMLAECIIGASSVAKAWSEYLDSLANHTISQTISENVGTFHSSFLGDYPDFLAFGVLCVLTVILTLGVKLSSLTMVLLSVVNCGVIVICVCAGIPLIDFQNWSQDGGFLPFGFTGVLQGAASCFFAFVGFDVIAMSNEESIRPSRDIPLSIALTLFICFISYTSVSFIVTLLVPYYAIPKTASLGGVFALRGAHVVEFLITIGSMVALTASMLGAVFAIPRLAFAMARDGLLFPVLAIVHTGTKVPVISCIVAGLLTATIAAILSLHQLIEMMSIGTLLAYMLVAVSVILLRYRPKRAGDHSLSETDRPIHEETSKIDTMENDKESEMERLVGPKLPSKASYLKVWRCTFLFVVISFPFSAVLTFGPSGGSTFRWILIFCEIMMGFVVVFTVYVISRQPQDTTDLPFKAPLLPYLPLLSIFCDIYLMLQLSLATWIRFAIWLMFGLVIYFGYGIWHSQAELEEEERNPHDRENNGNDVTEMVAAKNR